MALTLMGKVALVTGGSRGIGAATALALANEGANVAISYKDPDSASLASTIVSEIESKGRRAVALRSDQADTVQAIGLIQQVIEHFGQLDILVNNAAILVPGVVDDVARDTIKFERLMATNLTGVATLVRAAAGVMGQGGRIITLSSWLVSRIGMAGLADYTATKAAITGYTRGWAWDLGPRGITVNVIQPGCFDTNMNPVDSSFSNKLLPNIALGRYGRPEEVAAAIVFLASPGASYITGTSLVVDGGLLA